jgi:hypothetical protein
MLASQMGRQVIFAPQRIQADASFRPIVPQKPNVAAVLKAACARLATVLRITVQPIQVATGSHLPKLTGCVWKARCVRNSARVGNCAAQRRVAARCIEADGDRFGWQPFLAKVGLSDSLRGSVR